MTAARVKILPIWLGTVPYMQALQLQQHYRDLVSSSPNLVARQQPISSSGVVARQQQPISEQHHPNVLLALEHTPVYTVGIREKLYYSDSDERRLRQLGADFCRTDRGGLITFHGPGQLVLYPILRLIDFNQSRSSVRWYVDRLEQTVIDFCRQQFPQLWSLDAPRRLSPHTGIWIGDEKLCAIGLRVSRGVTSHGLALNCSTDLRWFDHIVPCGVEGKGVTSLTKLLGDVGGGRRIEPREVLAPLLQCFAQQFQCMFDDVVENLHIIST